MPEHVTDTATPKSVGVNWKQVSWTAVPIFISVAALAVSVRQATLSAEITNSTVYDRGVNVVLDLDKVYLANADIRSYFYENLRLEKADPNLHRVEALAEMTLDTYEIVLLEIRTHPSHYPSLTEYHQWVIDGFRMSEVLRNYFDKHASWYSKELGELRRSSG